MRHAVYPFDGGKVERLRDKAGYSAASFAALVGVNGAYMRRLELGERNPSPRIRNKIAEVLGVDIRDLAPDPQTAATV